MKAQVISRVINHVIHFHDGQIRSDDKDGKNKFEDIIVIHDFCSMRSLLITSMGNPGSQYANTLHSAGHTLLGALVAYTFSEPLSKSSQHAKGLVSSNSDLSVTFWQSPSYMNDSGPSLAVAWRVFSSASLNVNPHLVILHDELELNTGKFNVKTNTGTSARGHNGLKSFLAMPGMKSMQVTRVGVGIGPRPLSREPEDVARFVLRKMTGHERKEIEGLAGIVWEKLRQVNV